MILIRKLMSRLTTIILVICVIIIAILYIPKLFGVSTFSVLTGSMRPKCPVGSLVFAAKTDPKNIEVGDIISFYYGQNNSVVTHRVVEIDRDEECFFAEGDVQIDNQNKQQVPYSDVIGKVIFVMPLIGYLTIGLRSIYGKIVIGVLLAILVINLFIPEKEKHDEMDVYIE